LLGTKFKDVKSECVDSVKVEQDFELSCVKNKEFVPSNFAI
jgi:hypothetical protein